MLAVKTLKSDLNIFRRAMWLMGSQFEISVVGNDRLWAEDRIAMAINEVNRVEKLLSTFSDSSKVNEINRNAGIAPVKVDAEIFRLIDRSLQISELTNGAFDITYYSSESQYDTDHYTPVLAACSTYQSVVMDSKAMTVFLKEKGMRVSFVSNSKGYAADRAKYILQMQGVSSGVININGDLLTWGMQPDNEPWTVGTADPEQNRLPFAELNISNMSIASAVNSGIYGGADKTEYINVPNLKKGFPVSEINSVSVLSPTAEFSDALANPLMSIGVNAGLYLMNKLNQVGCIMIDDQNRIYTSDGINLTS